MDRPQTTRPEFSAAGSPYEIGFQYGSFFAAGINRFLEDNLARVNILRTDPFSPEAASQLVGRYAFWIEKDLPALAAEISGIAAGAGIRYDQAMLLQLRRELTRYQSGNCDCTSIAYSVEGQGNLLGQTVDLTANLSDQSLVLHVRTPDPSKPRICLLTFMGLCGYLGVNSNGLAIGLNMITSPGWRPGVPPYLLIRHLLGCSSIAEALDEIQRIRRASSRYLVLMDSNSAVGVELTVTGLRTIRRPILIHANHFLHPDFEASETLTGEDLAYSRWRVQRMATLVEQGVAIDDVLKDHEGFPKSVCAHNSGNPKIPETVAAVVISPDRRQLRIAFGHPCTAEFHSYYA